MGDTENFYLHCEWHGVVPSGLVNPFVAQQRFDTLEAALNYLEQLRYDSRYHLPRTIYVVHVHGGKAEVVADYSPIYVYPDAISFFDEDDWRRD